MNNSVVCGRMHTLFLSNDGHVFSSGSSQFHRGIHGHEDLRILSPKMIPSLINVKSISASSTHSICVDDDGNVYTFGINRNGQLGIGVDQNTLESTHIPQKVNIPPCKKFLVVVNLQYV